MSEAILKLVKMAQDHGMSGKLTHWSEADVWWFEGEMPQDILMAGGAESSVDYYEQAASPHYRGDIGFIDGNAKVAISFDTKKD
ncbi:hypothetical protein [Aurantiacibacter marinus]|uniref:Uncharacterized protein n=1 Tax=Aurantiacibacter marinus TaxID=874156 RepID=A0A0H0XQS2_9SPHN|nr:hypothetical protein [Aurantiacibacter marinus]KLI64709.1 hypothetical protein AAV99_04015 [Aurantiacibacter marinus]